MRFLERHRVGGRAPEGQLVESVRSLLSDGRKLAAIQNRAWNLGLRDSAQRVADQAYELLNSETRARGQR